MRIKRRVIGIMVAALLLLPTSAAMADGGGDDGIEQGETGTSRENFDSLKEQLTEASEKQDSVEIKERANSGRDDFVLLSPEGETLAALDYVEVDAADGDDSSFQTYAISPIYVGCDMSGVTATHMCVGQTGNKRTGFSGTGRYTTRMANVEVFQPGNRRSGVQNAANGVWIRSAAHQFAVLSSPVTINAVERT